MRTLNSWPFVFRNISSTVAKWLFGSRINMWVFHYLQRVGERFVLAPSRRIQKPTTTVTLAIIVQQRSSINTLRSTENDPKSLRREAAQTPKFNVEKSSVGYVVLGMAQ